MRRHEVDLDGRCTITELLTDQCAVCRGDDTTFVDSLLRREDDQIVPEFDEPEDAAYLGAWGEELAWRNLKLRTGKSRTAHRTSDPFPAKYEGECCRCTNPILKGQMIARTNVGYEHEGCGS